MKDFYFGQVYVASWIVDWIKNFKSLTDIGGNKFLEKRDDNFLIKCETKDCKQLNIGKKKKFTIVEGIKLF